MTESLVQGTPAMIRMMALQPLVTTLRQQGESADRLLARHGLSAQSMLDPYAMVSLSQYVGLFENAAETVRDADFGVRLAMTIRPADVGPMGVLFSLSPTLRAGFTRLTEHVNALQGGTHSSLLDVDQTLVWSYRLTEISAWPRRQDAEYTLVAACQLVRLSFNANWSPLEIHVEHSPRERSGLLARIVRAPVLYNQSANRIVMDRVECARIFRAEDVGLTMMLERHVTDLVQQNWEPQGLVDGVRKYIALSMGHSPVTLRAVASAMRLSPRSLQRRLTEGGTSLRDMVREHRIELARLRLPDGHRSVSDLATALGYADGTVLWRAMRKWEGRTPHLPKPDDGADQMIVLAQPKTRDQGSRDAD